MIRHLLTAPYSTAHDDYAADWALVGVIVLVDLPDLVPLLLAVAPEFFLSRVLSYQGAVRAMISATITRPELAAHRPGIRFGLINQALDPIAGTVGLPPERLAQLKHDLAAVISAEALFSLTDLCHLTPNDAVGSLIRTATTITATATRADGAGSSQPGKRSSRRR